MRRIARFLVIAAAVWVVAAVVPGVVVRGGVESYLVIALRPCWPRSSSAR